MMSVTALAEPRSDHVTCSDYGVTVFGEASLKTASYLLSHLDTMIPFRISGDL